MSSELSNICHLQINNCAIEIINSHIADYQILQEQLFKLYIINCVYILNSPEIIFRHLSDILYFK